jgi:hypothetical protein
MNAWHLRHVCFNDIDTRTEELQSTSRERMSHHYEQGFFLCKISEEIGKTKGKIKASKNDVGTWHQAA